MIFCNIYRKKRFCIFANWSDLEKTGVKHNSKISDFERPVHVYRNYGYFYNITVEKCWLCLFEWIIIIKDDAKLEQIFEINLNSIIKSLTEFKYSENVRPKDQLKAHLTKYIYNKNIKCFSPINYIVNNWLNHNERTVESVVFYIGDACIIWYT